MNAPNRKQRRAAAKGAKGLEIAGNQVGAALEALQTIKGLEGTSKMLEGLQENITQASAMIEALARDVQTLDAEMAFQREVNLRLLSKLYANKDLPETQALDQLKELEANIREVLVDELTKEPDSEKG